jgi:peptidoglycan/LPS O-acetylase OafA/YrhL
MLDRLKYIPQLETIRAFSILFVMIGHFIPASNLYFPFAQTGVRFFLLLSGFLITSILMYQKYRVQKGEISKTKYFSSFYKKRVLRIFPAYYLTLILLIFILPGFLHQAWIHFLYLSNIHFSMVGFEPHIGHFWSLAVEEQFYLICPLLLLITKRNEWIICLVGIALGLTFKYFIKEVSYFHEIAGSTLLPGCFDSLFLGCLLGVLYTKHRSFLFDRIKKIMPFIAATVLLMISLLITVRYSVNKSQFSYYAIVLTLLFNLLFCCIIYFILYNKEKQIIKPFHKLVFNNFFYRIGIISYSLYLIHNLVPYFLETPFNYLPFLPPTWLKITSYFIVSVLLAMLSYRWIEKPFLQLKSKIN